MLFTYLFNLALRKQNIIPIVYPTISCSFAKKILFFVFDKKEDLVQKQDLFLHQL